MRCRAPWLGVPLLLVAPRVRAEAASPRPSDHDPRIVPQPWWERSPALPAPYSRGEFEPIEGLLLAAWNDEVSGAFLHMLAQLDARSLPVYACQRSDEAWSSSAADLTESGLTGLVQWWDCGGLDSFWMRDFGPLFSQSEGGLRMVGDSEYYDARPLDDAFPLEAARHLEALWYEVPLRVEGGNLAFDGQGGCVASDLVWSQWENPGLGKEVVEQVLQRYSGCEQVVWLAPLEGEGTGHVDVFFTYLDAERVALGWYEPDYDTVNAAILEQNASQLQQAGYEVLRVPMPHHEDGDGDGIDDYRSHLNGIFVNFGQRPAYLMPRFDDAPETENEACSVLEDALPGFEVVTVDATPLVGWGGYLHCITKTIPALAWGDPCTDAYEFNDGDPACSDADPPRGCAQLPGDLSPRAGIWSLLTLAVLALARRRGKP